MKTKKILNLFFLLLLIFPHSSFALEFGQDAGQAVPGTETDQFDPNQSGQSAHITGAHDSPLENIKVDEQSPLVPGQGEYGKSVAGQDSPTQFNANAPFSGLDTSEYKTVTNEMILRPLVNKSKFSFAVDFYMNNFDYSDSRGIYDSTFKSNSGATGGSLNLSSDFYISKGAVNFGVGVGGGLGYATGKGIFSANGTVSDMNFNLYSIPVDFRFLMEIPLGRAVKFTTAAGPSAMVLRQNRSDRDAKEEGKTTTQVGYGYFGEAKLKLNLSYMMPDKGFEYYKFHEVNFMSVDLMMRTQNYSGFADNIEISGISYGIGVTFEFL
ncbi:hypothetical protein [Halobacteriovorax sp. HLS]|uniref:hypothetical protein n=1 Tax=Halobacteriovorax sp. HLS TaxID=2234000 RepID=UPI000FDCA836|nr:hypothetical protein [Halobacteriovorax sp. HLS]